ncbi:hypothetical protein OS190_14775 [Sulfitobacter sp. F26204]|uniref:hypothetical protein n=1 Tax=Sulfitobacter sp. F26204 TaxID=2996014 RepID=UPI00225DF65A|nr:hypothetical protein [Sulfitobacter sp. F26204]MCX7560838.1 hypothetical protein [Sulfitobacter sp. F26204]
MATKTKNQHQIFLESRPGKVLVSTLIVHMDAVIANAKRLLGTSAAKGGSGKDVASWKKDIAYLKKLRAEFVAEVKDIKSGKVESFSILDTLHEQCGEVLEWVEQRNHVYQVIYDAQIDVKIAAFMPLLGLLTSEGAKAIVQKRTLEQIIKDLKAAEKTTKSKSAKAALAVVLVGAGTLLPPLGVAGTMFALTATLVASDIGGRAIDYAVGETSGPPDALKTVYTVADGSIAAAGQQSKAAEALGKKTAAFGLVWEAGDAGHALYKQKNLEKRLNDLCKEIKASAAATQKKAKKVQALQKTALASLKKARSNAASFSTSKKTRGRIQQDFNKYHDMN